MSRPLRLQFPGALYHVTSRGDRKRTIYLDEVDRVVWLAILGEVCADYHFVIHGFCQMGNHYHLVVETEEANLALGMQQLNGKYSQYFNRQHDLVGHLFQGRYHAVLAQRDAYLLQLARYVVLNPVRAGLVTLPGDWPWSSYRHLIGQQAPPNWLNVAATLAMFAHDPEGAIPAYQRFVLAGISSPSPLLNTRHQLVLGDDAFLASIRLPANQNALRSVIKSQRQALAPPLEAFQAQAPTRNAAMIDAHHSGAYTMQQIAAHFGVALKTVSRVIKKDRTR